MDQGCIVSINVGLNGEAVKGKRWNRHRADLLDILVAALKHGFVNTIGMLVSEVGSVDDPYDDEGRAKFDHLFKQAFRIAERPTGASEHNELQICWATGEAAETAMVFK